MAKLLHHSIFNLALAPTSVDSFDYLLKDPQITNVLGESSLYVVVKRPIIVFKGISRIEDDLKFQIYQPFTGESIECILPLKQHNLVQEIDDLLLSFKSDLINIDWCEDIIFKSRSGIAERFRWHTPDSILEQYWKGQLQCKLSGNIEKLLEFEVKYIGESVLQDIHKRIGSHSKIQKILTKENSITKGIRASKELFILILALNKTKDARDESQMTENESKNYLSGNDSPSDSTIYLDAEKMLINHFKPAMNTIKYKQYPKSKNGMISERFNSWSMEITDPIRLKCEGATDLVGGDIITVDNLK